MEYCKKNQKDSSCINTKDSIALKKFLNDITEFARKEGYITINQSNPDGYFIELTEKGKRFVKSKL